MYITPFMTARMSVRRLPPPGFAGGINGLTYAHSSSVGRLLGVRPRFRAFSGQPIGRAEHGHGRSEQPDQGTPVHTSAIAFDVWEVGLISACAADVLPRLHALPPVPRSTPLCSRAH